MLDKTSRTAPSASSGNIRSDGGPCRGDWLLDITDHAAVKKAVAAFEADVGPTDILVNNAG